MSSSTRQEDPGAPHVDRAARQAESFAQAVDEVERVDNDYKRAWARATHSGSRQ
jgi:hypothetical protein